MDRALQDRLARALLDPGQTLALDPALDALFDVHRNTATLGLLDALRESYPTTRRLLGSEAFDAAALRHLRANPPSSPVLLEWGHGFPDELADMPGMQGWEWIAEVASLESARRRAYHAADRPRAPWRCVLQAASDPRSDCLALHPSTQRVSCQAPALDIWLSQNGLADPPRPEHWRPSQLLIWRRDETLQARQLDAFGLALLHAAERHAPVVALLDATPSLSDPLAEALQAGWLLIDYP